jgi:hypothetical protein
MATGALETKKSPTADQFIATEVILEDGKNKNIQRVIINNPDGTTKQLFNIDKTGLATDAKIESLISKLPESVGPKPKDTSLSIVLASDIGALPVNADGTPINESSQETGGSGTIGWLSAIATFIKTLKLQLPASLGTKISAESLSVVPSSDSTFNTSPADKSNVGYMSMFTLVPTTTLAAGTTYLAFFNGSAKTIKFGKFRINQQFIGTAAASVSNFEIIAYNHNAQPTGGTLIPSDIIPIRSNNTTPTIATIRASNIGGVVSGGTQDTKKLIFGSSNQLSIGYEFDLISNNLPFTLAPNTGIVLKANTIIVAGTTLRISLTWEEV